MTPLQNVASTFETCGRPQISFPATRRSRPSQRGRECPLTVLRIQSIRLRHDARAFAITLNVDFLADKHIWASRLRHLNQYT